MKAKIAIFCALFLSVYSFSQQKKWTLQECVDYAIDNNISIKQMQLTADMSDQDREAAIGAMLPNLGAQASQSFSFGSSINQTNERVSSDVLQSNFGLNSSVTVFNGFKLRNSYKQSKIDYESSLFDIQKTEDDITLDIVNAYLTILFDKENLNIAIAKLEITKEQLERTRELVEAGSKPKVDLYDVQASLAKDEQKVVEQENKLEISKLTLAQILQVDYQGFEIAEVEVTLPSGSILLESSNQIYKESLALRPEIKKAEIALTGAELATDIARADYYPSLSFSAGLSTFYLHQQGGNEIIFNPMTNTFLDNRFKEQVSNNLNKSFQFTLTIPIFSNLMVKTNVAKAKLNSQIAEYELESQKLALQQTIQSAYLDAKAALKTYEASEISLVAQQKSFENAQIKYNLGSMTSFDFDKVKQELIEAQSTLVRSKYDFVFKIKVLEFYKGMTITAE
ncbi:TolC family protein [Aureivirga marina]|uniref:TolC family protein n=1 Tax=Aureivirga marina TaxID=1182451 RepID=UPI0018C99C7D|nr:TolC family protein [Aureivirga marina]